MIGARRPRATRRVVPGAVRPHEPGELLRCLVLATGENEWAAAELSTGALLRLEAPSAEAEGPAVAPLDVVEVEVGHEDEPFDPHRPEAVVLARNPVPLRPLRPAATRRLLRAIARPNTGRALLGTIGPSLAYAELDSGRPSLELIAPGSGSLDLVPDGEGGGWCRFSWGGTNQRLPLSDGRACELIGGRRRPMRRAEVDAALGYRTRYLLIGLEAPRGGHSRKTVLALLQRGPTGRRT